jgi:hypothetical protein
MPYVGFEPTIPASERAKTVHALNRSSTVTGLINVYNCAKCCPRITEGVGSRVPALKIRELSGFC